ncbi:hypothetical protein [Dendronalium sp. ChiSLP03b]|nr:hypothetical protein [Dendronalium sp. ChiSLP03b]
MSQCGLGEPLRWAALPTCRRALRGFPQGSKWRGFPHEQLTLAKR